MRVPSAVNPQFQIFGTFLHNPLSDIGTGGETAPVEPTARLVIYQSCDAAPTVARFAIRHSKLTYRLFRNTGNSLSLLKYLNAAVTHEGPAPATGHEVH